MNERIRELADKAAKYSATMFLPTGENGDELFVGKFAELLIRECANVVSNQYSEDWGKWSNRMILEHFGVDT